MTASPRDPAAAAAADAAARERIHSSLDESLLVEAAAGTGKTTALVGRLVAVLASGRTTVDRIVAVTFTRKAAGELKLRLRQELDAELERTEDARARAHLERAVARLEEAQIGTIHSFCAEILRTRPVEARVDPGFVELDEDEQRALYARAFHSWIERRLDESPEGLSRALARLALEGGPGADPALDRLRGAGWDLVEWRHLDAPWERRPFDREGAIDAVVEMVHHVAELSRNPSHPRDSLAWHLRPVRELDRRIERSEKASAGRRDYDEIEAWLTRHLPRELRWPKKGRGRWYADGVERDAVVAARDALVEALEELTRHADADLAVLLREELEQVGERYQELKAAHGALDFLDLLLETRDLLRSDAEIRRLYQRRFSHIFIDEFQDTDPLQVEILLLLAADDPAEPDWRRTRPVPGKLFLVGDPKQSIYRFRYADILLYQEVKELLAEAGVPLIHLSKSWRAVDSLQRAVNAAFAPEMTGDPGAGQPEYVPLAKAREDPADQPAVVALPVPEPYGVRNLSNAAIEESLPDAVGAWIDWLLNESGWRVEEEVGEGDRRRVPVAPRHICLLFRRFVSWRSDVTTPYVRAFEARDIPHVLVEGRSLHQREEVETVRLALAAIEWPDDELAVYATLKRSLLALPDELLFRWREEVGPLHPFRPRPLDLDPDLGPVAEALALLARLHRARNARPVVATINELLRVTRTHAAFALRPAGNQVLANVQQVCDLARRFELRGGLSFRAFVEWLEEKAALVGSRHSAALEEGAEGVRIMTVHGAKGLEFPVVVLCDPMCKLSRDRPGRVVDAREGLAATQLLGCAPWELVDRAEAEAERDAAEGARLAYVAATRARDLLVVPVVGDREKKGGWLEPLHRAVYPDTEGWRRPAGAGGEADLGLPTFGASSVLRRPMSQEGAVEASVRPGLHRPRRGEHQVAWWDPAVLKLGQEPGFGLREEQVLAEDDEGAAMEGLERYLAWRREHRAAVGEGSAASLRVRPVGALVAAAAEPAPARGEASDAASSSAAAEPADDPDLARQITEAAARLGLAGRSGESADARPGGVRFGTLVHTVLRDIDLAATTEAVRELVDLHGRVLEAPAAERKAAVEAVATALATPLMERAAAAKRRHREAPFVLHLGDGEMVEGTVDLVFQEAGEGWSVVDFKTDLAGAAEEVVEGYRRQVAWYLVAFERLTGRRAEGWLLGV